jgi:riboflavin synthase
MFTGIIEELGTVQSILRNGGGCTLSIGARNTLDDLEIGHSISVNGICLTVTSLDRHSFTVQAVEETVQKTTLYKIREGDRVNLERAMKPSDRLGGHIVTGHVEGIGIIRSKVEREGGVILSIDVPRDISRYVVPKGSVAVDGVSLTVVALMGSQVIVSIIPHTARVTTLGFRKRNDEVNIETDLIGRYVEKLIGSKKNGITESWLKDMGY